VPVFILRQTRHESQGVGSKSALFVSLQAQSQLRKLEAIERNYKPPENSPFSVEAWYAVVLINLCVGVGVWGYNKEVEITALGRI
jgi:hypothetical protein